MTDDILILFQEKKSIWSEDLLAKTKKELKVKRQLSRQLITTGRPQSLRRWLGVYLPCQIYEQYERLNDSLNVISSNEMGDCLKFVFVSSAENFQVSPRPLVNLLEVMALRPFLRYFYQMCDKPTDSNLSWNNFLRLTTFGHTRSPLDLCGNLSGRQVNTSTTL